MCYDGTHGKKMAGPAMEEISKPAEHVKGGRKCFDCPKQDEAALITSLL